MADREVKVRFTARDGATPAVEAVEDALRGLAAPAEAASAALGDVSGRANGLRGAADGASGGLPDAMSALSAGADAAGDAVGGLSDQSAQASDAMDGLSAASVTATDAVGGLSDQSSQATDAVGGLSDQSSQATDAMGGLSDQSSQATDVMDGLSAASGTATDAMGGLSGQSSQASDAMGGLSDQSSQASGALDTLSGASGSADDAMDGLSAASGTASAAMDGLSGQSSQASGALDTLSGASGSADDALDDTAEAADKAADGLRDVSDGGRSAEKALASAAMKGNLAATAVSWLASKAAAAGAAIVSAFRDGAAAVARYGAEQESARLKMQVMLSDAAKGNRLFARLQSFSNATPFSTGEVVKAGRTLLGFGVAAGDVEEVLLRVGNAASAVGRGLDDVASMYGKAMVKGKADAETLNQMGEAGIPVVRRLARELGVAEAEVYALASKGRISSSMLADAFTAMSARGGEFAGMMSRQSRTVGGLWSTLQGKIQMAAGALGEQLAPAMSAALDMAIRLADRVGAAVADGTVVERLGDWTRVGVAFFAELLKTGQACASGLKAVFMTVADAVGATWHAVMAEVETAMGLAAQAMGRRDKAGEWYARADAHQAAAEEAARGAAGGRFAQAKDETDEFARTVDGMAGKVDKAVSGAVASVLGKLRSDRAAADRAVLARGAMGAAAPAAETGEKAGEAETPRADAEAAVDSLARIGLYNFGAAASDALDVQRNQLLQTIADRIGRDRQEVYAI